MLLTVCIEAGRKTLTHTSWTGIPLGSRKWMSGQAAALAARNDRRLLANFTVVITLRDSSPPSARRPPSPLDFYLSWMSPYFCPHISVPIFPVLNVNEMRVIASFTDDHAMCVNPAH